MKRLFVGFFAVLFAVCICSSAVLPTMAINESNQKGVTFSAVLDSDKLEITGAEQLVVLTLKADSPITLDGIGFNMVCADPISIKAIEGNGNDIAITAGDYNLQAGIVGWSTPDAENISGVTTIAKITFAVPANIEDGTYMVGVYDIEVTSDYGEIWESGALAAAVITVGDPPEPEDTTAKPEDTTAKPEDTTAEPEDTTAEPEDTTAEPEDTTAKPEDTTAKPEDTTAKPEDTTVEPEDTTNEGEDTVLPFADVTKGDWFYQSVVYAYTNKIMQGTGATEFAPNVPTTRAMLVTMLWRLDDSPLLNRTNTFADVSGGAWYAAPVEWAYKNQIVMGYDESTFAPDALITREQMVTILWRYAKYKGLDVTVHGPIPFAEFTDGDSVSSYAFVPMGWALGTKLIQGVNDTTLAPQQSATRAQVATVLMRFIENTK